MPQIKDSCESQKVKKNSSRRRIGCAFPITSCAGFPFHLRPSCKAIARSRASWLESIRCSGVSRRFSLMSESSMPYSFARSAAVLPSSVRQNGARMLSREGEFVGIMAKLLLIRPFAATGRFWSGSRPAGGSLPRRELPEEALGSRMAGICDERPSGGLGGFCGVFHS